MNKSKYKINQACRIGFNGSIYEAGSLIELNEADAEKLKDYISPAKQTEQKAVAKKPVRAPK